MTDYDTLGSSLVLVGCLAKRKCTINRRLQKRSDMEQFRHFGSVFVKEDRENGKSGAEAVFVYATKSQGATRQSQRLRLRRAIKSRTRATTSRDKIAGVTLVLQASSDHGHRIDKLYLGGLDTRRPIATAADRVATDHSQSRRR